jgi:hypothetical protein
MELWYKETWTGLEVCEVGRITAPRIICLGTGIDLNVGGRKSYTEAEMNGTTTRPSERVRAMGKDEILFERRPVLGENQYGVAHGVTGYSDRPTDL